MKGIVFTEFLDMVDAQFGMPVTEAIVANAQLRSGGAYTSVGTYCHSEIVSLVTELSRETNIEVPRLVQTFGTHLLDRFLVLFPQFFDDTPHLYGFLENVDGYIHGEVRKLYPNATLPEIETKRLDDGKFILTYKSARQMADLAEGLILGAIDHFGGRFTCLRRDLPAEGEKQCVRFMLAPRQLH